MFKKYIMLKGFILLLFAFICRVSYAQNVGINDNGVAPDASAMLDVVSTTKGFLAPRMTLAERGLIQNPVKGLLIYQISDVQGFYYYTGSAWTLLSSSSFSGWSSTGNSSTTAGTNFLGTTDAVDFVIKTNNVERARYLSSGYAGIGTSTPAAPLHVSSTSGNILYLQSTTGGSGTQASIAFKTYGGTTYPTGLISAVDNNYSSYFAFFTKVPGADANPLSERMRITTTGEVAIGTTSPHASAKLDITSTSQGLLIPRVQLTGTDAAGPITSPETSLLVYNTAQTPVAANQVTPGFYYWDSNVWTRLASGGTGPSSLWTQSGSNMYSNTTGSVGIGSGGSPSFNSTTATIDGVANQVQTEKFLVNAGTTTSRNAIVAKGSINSYLQTNIQNTSAGNAASTDVVASNDNATERTTYIDMGINSTGNTSTDALGGANNAYLYNKSGDLTIGTASVDKNLRFITGGQTEDNIRMKIDSLGNVGIGTANYDISTSRLSIDGGTISSATNLGLGSVLSIEGNRNQYLELNIKNTNSGNSASSDIVATANNGDDFSNYIDMGINSSSYSNSKSNILNTPNVAYLYANSAAAFKIGNGGLGQPLVFFTNPSTGTLGTLTAKGFERMQINGDGNVGIGDFSSTTIASKLTVDGDITPKEDDNGGREHTLGTSALRWDAVYATNGAIQTSDRRMKTNILNLEYGLKEIMSLQPVRYNWIDSPSDNNKVGLIAQDVKKIVPEVVVGDESKTKLSMNYAELVPVLINAIKEQQKQIDELKQQVQNSKNNNTFLSK